LTGSPNYYSPSGIHCENCPAVRFEGLWFSGSQVGILADPNGNGYGTELLKVWGNSFEYTYSALKWNNGRHGSNVFLDMHDNMIDIGSFNWVVKGDGSNFGLD
jgi:hypothetical protein